MPIFSFKISLTEIDGSDNTYMSGENNAEPSSFDATFDNTYSIGEIIEYRDTDGYDIYYLYMGQHGDGIIIQIDTTLDANFVSREFFIYSNTDYSNSLIEADQSDFTACFLVGTQIMTAAGLRHVETLRLADLVLTAEGRAVPVKWIGRQTIHRTFNRDEDRAPICIDAGALSSCGGRDLPARDLKLTADHALLMDGVLVQAGALVNGTTIRRMTKAETGDSYTVFHIETEGHEIILAEGCPAETFVDSVTRRRFDNYAEYETLFGDKAETILEMDLPRALSARQLPESIRALIATPLAA